MNRWFLGVYIGISIVLTSIMLMPAVDRELSRLDARLLFALRGAVEPPESVVIVSADRYDHNALKQPDKLRHWDRRIHAKLLRCLVTGGVAEIAMDLEFDHERSDQKQDTSLGNAIRDAGNVTLVQRTKPFLIRDDGGGGAINEGSLRRKVERSPGHFLINPIDIFAESAAWLAPNILPEDGLMMSAYAPSNAYLYQPESHRCYGYSRSDLEAFLQGGEKRLLAHERVMTLPVAIAERQLARSGALDASVHQAFERQDCAALTRIRKQHRALAAAQHSAPAQAVWQSLLRKPSGAAELLSFYGPAGAFQTLAYRELLGEDAHTCLAEAFPALENALVLVGSADSDMGDPADRYATPVGKLSGVEITATALANVLQGKRLWRYGWQESLVIGVVMSLAAGLIALAWRRSRWYWPVGLLAIIGYFWAAVTLFSDKGVWLPVVFPALLMLPGLLWILRHREMIAAKLGAERTLAQYLPKDARALPGGDAQRAAFGCCLITDVAGFTGAVEGLSASQAATLVNDYVARLSEAVNHHGGEVYLVDGDSLTCVWLAAHQDADDAALRGRALSGAKAVIDAVEEFNHRHPDTPFLTRMGMDCGQLSVGNVGGEAHLSFAVVGDAVYTASRLEQLNKHIGGRCVATARMMVGLHLDEVRSLGVVALRGKQNLEALVELWMPEVRQDGEALAYFQAFSHAVRALSAGDFQAARARFSALQPSGRDRGLVQRYLAEIDAYQQRVASAATQPVQGDWKMRFDKEASGMDNE